MKKINYYTTGITANGCVSYLEDNLKDLEKVYLITGEADYSYIFNKVLELWQNEDNIEYINNPYKFGTYEGIINKNKKIGVILDINPYMTNILLKKDYIEVIDLSEVTKKDYKKYQNIILQLKLNKFNCNESAYLYLGKAIKIHDEWEEIYVDNMDFCVADEIAKDLQKKIIPVTKIRKIGNKVDRFFGGVTPKGPKDFVPSIIEEMDKRYFIKGRPGTGKSTILRKIGKYAMESGYDIEIYHCGFDSNSLDMILVRELSVCIFDSTAPHEYFPNKVNDEIVDVYIKAVKPFTDDKYKLELADITSRYKSNIDIAVAFVNTMKVINDQINFYLNKITNKDIYEKICNDLIKKL